MSRLPSVLVAAATLLSPAVAQDPLPGAPIPEGTEIQKTASGLRYAVLRPAPDDAKSPTSFLDGFTAHYTGWLASGGTKFDSSYDRDAPLTLRVGQVIPGWGEGLQLMGVGAKYKFIIPSDLGYGPRGSPPTIPPNADLVFDVELLGVDIAELPDFTLPHEELANCKEHESGLLIQRLEEGDGESIGPTDKVTLHYTMWLPDGTVLDSSRVAPEAPQIEVASLGLEGMSIALQTMRAGGAANVLIPSSLAFGPRPAGRIPANSDVVCRLDVESVTKGAQPLPKPSFRMPPEDELTTTASGLKYKVLEEGEGLSPTVTDRVSVHYAGWLTDGTAFDDSYTRGEPATFPLRGVIPGWTEGLQLMQPGAEYLFVIPGDLAYGPNGRPPVIPPDATLVFHVELLEVES